MLFNRAVFVAQSVAYTHTLRGLFRDRRQLQSFATGARQKTVLFFWNYSKQDYLICFKFIGNGQALAPAIFATLFFKVGPIARARA